MGSPHPKSLSEWERGFESCAPSPFGEKGLGDEGVPLLSLTCSQIQLAQVPGH